MKGRRSWEGWDADSLRSFVKCEEQPWLGHGPIVEGHLIFYPTPNHLRRQSPQVNSPQEVSEGFQEGQKGPRGWQGGPRKASRGVLGGQ